MNKEGDMIIFQAYYLLYRVDYPGVTDIKTETESCLQAQNFPLRR